MFGPEYYFNYELSWLEFNSRVLSEAETAENNLLERVKFIGIVCSNLDEFFQKRVGGLKRQLHAGVHTISGGTIPTADQTYVGVVQARSESSGAVEATGGDAGGQIFMFTMNPTD